ncbi:bifunctional 4-hydroxy-2-oxoglutarate aldolase/2-dehydro-3-deoxy-phosphogluconate aldolase [Halieaceae bacterium IMCC14734]|uniref:2-dehydro-3-deoxy-phosphogluconate aldolase n=1 Tax=Candidatus Litorirhabdus singularis TaxID=2518993 RepID=A0ABT3TL02_9GAMM|nr:bifunctional 4-hydroxy-2-oxoglutarate aldolase/2-dehydro-3-deoxy-phosphogluconate aldolase [Candidatus Litorirhabdus singularis]MCX2982094.1 bifunctional 4-hydroxy-2-oxoglutarate aldolase/2-dehydro-3-deoxy-phosphogluconate aldolase [Candidatus Litorirhabdus singularis]
MIAEKLSKARVLPVITATSASSTVELARALHRGGMQAVEITLRTSAALDSIRAVAAELPELLVAAGTVTNPAELDAAVAAGATMVVSPGSTPQLLRAARDAGVDFVPGVATASEVMQGLDEGYSCFKLFPAVAVGGLALLKSLGGPYPDVRFCPTGGLTPANFRDYLALPNVVCCGGSWMVAADLVDNQQWDQIENLARDAMSPLAQGE